MRKVKIKDDNGKLIEIDIEKDDQKGEEAHDPKSGKGSSQAKALVRQRLWAKEREREREREGGREKAAAHLNRPSIHPSVRPSVTSIAVIESYCVCA